MLSVTTHVRAFMDMPSTEMEALLMWDGIKLGSLWARHLPSPSPVHMDCVRNPAAAFRMDPGIHLWMMCPPNGSTDGSRILSALRLDPETIPDQLINLKS
mmetsp:Transcript_36469/g.82604  ORF Transcript_36469/g.82604 Transcript_36469/m.82604 type:complete len:100 (-) Transcript_36469:299-598(-)